MDVDIKDLFLCADIATSRVITLSAKANNKVIVIILGIKKNLQYNFGA